MSSDDDEKERVKSYEDAKAYHQVVIQKYRQMHSHQWMTHDDCTVTSRHVERQNRKRAGEWTWQEYHLVEGFKQSFDKRDRMDRPQGIFWLIPWMDIDNGALRENMSICLRNGRFRPFSIRVDPIGIIVEQAWRICGLMSFSSRETLSWEQLARIDRDRLQAFQRQEVLHGHYTYDRSVQLVARRLPRELCRIVWGYAFFCPRIQIDP